MSKIDTFMCSECGEEFAAHPESNAAETGFCCPLCAAAGMQ